MTGRAARTGIVALLLVGAGPPLEPVRPPLAPEELVRRAEQALRGDTALMRAVMTITTPRWTRQVAFRSWDDRLGDRSFIRILSPRKDRGTGFLRIGETFWTYLPRVERTTRIPPSMMLQSWMGSDFSNDDVARESSMIDDYTAEFLGQREIDAQLAVGVELRPREEAPVVWARLDVWLRASDYAPLLYLYYDEASEGTFELLRRLRFSEVRQVQGRPFPHVWAMETIDKPGRRTEIRVEEIRLDEKLADEVFSHANLERAEALR